MTLTPAHKLWIAKKAIAMGYDLENGLLGNFIEGIAQYITNGVYVPGNPMNEFVPDDLKEIGVTGKASASAYPVEQDTPMRFTIYPRDYHDKRRQRLIDEFPEPK